MIDGDILEDWAKYNLIFWRNTGKNRHTNDL